MDNLFAMLMFLLLMVCVGFTYNEGMWSNAVRLINLVTAALLATNFYEPAARWLDGWQPSYSYLWDFLALWALFVVFMVVLRELTDRISLVKVKFLKIADRIGSGFFSLWCGWVVVCFAMFSLHTAPLDHKFFFGGFVPEERMFMGLAPDRQWLGYMQKMSKGTFSRTGTAEEVQGGKYGPAMGPGDDASLCVFDRGGEFLPKYATRRSLCKANVDSKGTLRNL